jgi:hypothetical protein
MSVQQRCAKVTETCRELLQACDVSDINVQEVPVE